MNMHKGRVTEILVRMDCNGCVQKIKKALNGVPGIYDLYIDLPHQKITAVGVAHPEDILKAIKKTRKSAIICSHDDTHQPHNDDKPESDPSPDPPTQPQGGGSQATHCSSTPSDQKVQAETPPPVEPQGSSSPPPQNNAKPFPESQNAPTDQHTAQPPKLRGDVEEIHVIHHHPSEYIGYRHAFGQNPQHGSGRQWSSDSRGFIGEPYPYCFPSGSGFRGELPSQSYTARGASRYKDDTYHSYTARGASGGYRDAPSQPSMSPQGLEGEMSQPYTRSTPPTHTNIPSHPYPGNPGFGGEPFQQAAYVTHNYNMHNPSPHATKYAYPHSPLRYSQSQYTTPGYYYNQEYYSGNETSGNANITSMFSEENPNACKIV